MIQNHSTNNKVYQIKNNYDLINNSLKLKLLLISHSSLKPQLTLSI